MKIREGEKILRVYRHHPTPFFYDLVKVLLGAFPFFFVAFIIEGTMTGSHFIILLLALFVVFLLVIVYVSLIYWLDKLIITNLRVVHVDWKYLTVKDEAEASLSSIQDIQTEEAGLLAHFKIFDYGTIRLDTASSYVTMEFRNVPNPEGIRKFIFHLRDQ